MIDSADTGGRLAVVEHVLGPRVLAAPLHLHTLEDEYSYVLEGRVGALLGDEEVFAGPGDLLFKPRGQWHTFWNAGDSRVANRYGCQADFEGTMPIVERHGLNF